MVDKKKTHSGFAQNLMATGVNHIPDGYDYAVDPALHEETTKAGGKITSQKFYKTWDGGTETLSNLAVDVSLVFTGNNLDSKTIIFYFEDNTVAFTDTLSYKTDSVDSNKTLVTKSRV